MRALAVWVDKVQDPNRCEQCIYDLCFNPDGSQLIAAAGQAILVYNCNDGSVFQTLKGHKDTVYCVAYCYDGRRFASGGADKIVIIWTSKLEALLKYTHNDAVQCLQFNPVTHVLASCAMSDFSFWSPEVKSVPKYKTVARVNACTWSSDGQHLALGLANGNVSVRTANGDEKYIIERDGEAVWALAFSPKREEKEILCITDWSRKLTFYSIDGNGVNRERSIGFEALSVNYMSKGDYILVAGCNKQCVLLSNEGMKLGVIGDEQLSWIWCSAVHPTAPYVVVGCQDGTVAYHQVAFSIVHGLYKEKYAFRENMTDVIIQHLITNEKVRIKCRDWVKKIAIYKNRLAVLLPSKVVIYELYSKGSDEMHYRIKDKLNKSLECNLLVICSEHLILCQESKLLCYTFDAKNVGQWMLDSTVRYIRVIGGPAGGESLGIGLADGQVLKVYINNPFPVTLMKSSSAVLCLDFNMSKTQLAIVNEENQCIVYDISNDQILLKESKASSVAWNSLFEDMLCFSGNDHLNVKISNCSPLQMKFTGYVVGVYGSKVFSLCASNIVTVDIPLSAPMYQAIEKQRFEEAYSVACLGITENDWRSLARSALNGFNLAVAVKSFIKIKDLKLLELIYDFQENKDERSKDSFMGDVLAFDCKFKEAGKYYTKCGESNKALSMYTDLRMFDLAQEFVRAESNNDKKSLIRKKAEWAKNVNEPKIAAEMYLSAGDVFKAVDIAMEHGWKDMLIELSRKLDKIEVDTLKKIAAGLSKLGEVDVASEIYQRIGEEENILQLHVNMKNWEVAYSLIEKYPQFGSSFYLPYAQWLIENDRFVEAQQAFRKAGKPEDATIVLNKLLSNAVDEGRFEDAGYYHWILSRQYLDMAKTMEHKKEELIRKFHVHDKYASIYYAYHAIQKYLEEPFTSYQPEALFNISRFLMNETREFRPDGVMQFSILYSLAKQAKTLGGFKIARQALERIQHLRIPPHFQDFVDLASITIKAKSYQDNEELLIMCYRCSSYNPLTLSSSTTGNCCVNCHQPFVFSYVTFEVLPVIEFQLENGISDTEAIKLLHSVESNEVYNQPIETGIQSLMIDDPAQNITDLFTAALINLESEGDKFSLITVNRETLLSMDSNSVLICELPSPLCYRYYRNLVPELQITACNSCFKIFHVDDFEMEVLQKGYCPFCRVSPATLET